MSSKNRIDSETGVTIVKSAWKGSRKVGNIIIGGLALSFGMKAFNSTS